MTALRSGCSGCTERFGVGRRTLCVRTGADLGPLLRTMRRYDSVLIISNVVTPPERKAWERRLLDSYTECGCQAGGVALLVALGVLVIMALLTPRAWTWTGIGIGIAFCFSAAVAGKLVGIAAARVRLWRDVRRCRSLLSASSAECKSAY